MRPISQTFYINETGGVNASSGVFITRIDVFFKTINSTRGVTLEIRETENGVPSNKVVPFGSCRLSPLASAKVERTDMLAGYNKTTKQHVTQEIFDGLSESNRLKYPIYTSDSSISTAFEFATPVFVQANKSYAFVILPDGGCDGYEVWSADYTGGVLIKTGAVDTTGGNYVTDGGVDIITKTPVSENNDTGDLFLSSNDRAWLPVITEDLKFEIFRANFTATTGTAYFNTLNEDFFTYKDEAGPGFEIREKVVFSNGYYNIAKLNVSSSTGVSVGDTITQSGFTGKVNAVSTGVILLSNTTGAFTTGSATDSTTSTSLTVTGVSQNVETVSGSKTVNVPDSSIYSLNQVLFFQTSNRSESQVVKIEGLPVGSGTTITANTALKFSNNNTLHGRVMADGALNGGFSSKFTYKDTTYSILDSITSSTLSNLANYTNNQVIGLSTGTSSTVTEINNKKYNTIHFKYNYQQLPNTGIDFSFSTFYNDTTDPLNPYPESDFTYINVNKITDLKDQERISLSRSNSLGLLPSGRKGDSPIVLRANLDTENSKVSPIIDTMLSDVSIYQNLLNPKSEYDGAYLRIVENNQAFGVGDIVSQTAYGNTTTATIVEANTTQIRVSNVNGKFINDTAFTTDKGQGGHVNVAEMFNESMDNGYYKASRYISKNVILAEGQDSEDMRVYLGAYRPANTDFLVYAKVQSSLDHDINSNKSWTKLREVSDSSLQSSKVNENDLVELIYTFNQSKNLFTSNSTGNTTSQTVTVASTESITNNSIVYFGIEPVKFSGSISGTTLTVASITTQTGYTGKLVVGQKIYGDGVTEGTYISALIPSTGGTGGAGTYTISPTQSVGSITMIAGETAFNVREVIYVVDGTTLTIDRPLSTSTGNSTLGIIPGADSTTGAFLYDKNNNVVRYCTATDAVYDNYIQFSMKIVPTADTTSIIPMVNDMRVLALQV
jgi:hypothetical protein